MRSQRQAGFTLIELIISMLLGVMVLIGLSSILTPLVRSQAYSSRSQTVQLNLAAVAQLVERELRQASLISRPALAATPSGALEGCANAAGSPPAQIDTGAPMSWFAFCTTGGVVYYHSGEGCPAFYTCGSLPTAAFVWGPAPWSALSFVRPALNSTLITTDLRASSGNTKAQVTSAIAFSAPAGGAQ